MNRSRDRIIQEIIENMVLMRRGIVSQRKIPLGNRRVYRGEMIALTIVGNCRGLSIKDIAERMDISGSAATQLIDSLVKEGLLTREGDPNDRRIVRISLTDKGKGRLEKFRKARVKAMRKILSPLDNQELEMFRNLLEKIIAGNPSSNGRGLKND